MERIINFRDDVIEYYDNGRCCNKALGVVISLIAVIMIIAMVGGYYDDPIVYIQELYVPGLTTQTKLNSSIFIDIEFYRAMAFTRRSYDEFQISLWYGSDRSFPLANHSIPAFSMGYKRRVHKKAAVEASRRPLPWEEAFHNVSGGPTVTFLVELVDKHYKFEYCSDDFYSQCWWSEAEVVMAAATVSVDASGHKLSKEPIILTH